MHFLADQVRIFAKCLREVGDNGVIDGCVEEIGRGCMVFFRFAVQLFPKFCSSNVSSVRNNRQLSNQATTMRCVLIRCFAFDSGRRGGRKGMLSRHEMRAVRVAMSCLAPTSQGFISKKGYRAWRSPLSKIMLDSRRGIPPVFMLLLPIAVFTSPDSEYM